MWQQLAFLAQRQETRLSKKGHEIRSIPERLKEEHAKSSVVEWNKLIQYDSVELVPPEVAATLDKNSILPLRPVRTDENEATRGDKTYEDHPSWRRRGWGIQATRIHRPWKHHFRRMRLRCRQKEQP